MTAKQVYLYTLVELNKVNAPSLLLEDFNYLFNKAINLYINKKYNTFEINQQSTDDLRVLKSTAILTPTSLMNTGIFKKEEMNDVTLMHSLYGGTYEVDLPQDYLHILNCICIYKVKQTYSCYTKDSYVQFGAKRLTADIAAEIINNFYMKPSYKRPYYYIHNINTVNDGTMPTNPILYNGDEYVRGTDYVPGEVEKDPEYTFTASSSSQKWTTSTDSRTISITSYVDNGDGSEPLEFSYELSNNDYWKVEKQENTLTILPTLALGSATRKCTITLTLVLSNKTIAISLELVAKTIAPITYTIKFGVCNKLTPTNNFTDNSEYKFVTATTSQINNNTITFTISNNQSLIAFTSQTKQFVIKQENIPSGYRLSSVEHYAMGNWLPLVQVDNLQQKDDYFYVTLSSGANSTNEQFKITFTKPN